MATFPEDVRYFERYKLNRFIAQAPESDTDHTTRRGGQKGPTLVEQTPAIHPITLSLSQTFIVHFIWGASGR
ncbi:hypothetical protein E4U22_003384 [Claviceps purpurea]|nr:hypothetical protein E4U28_006628 [Claviceps purpurea]KAG6222469.1 hypothetical protein E4U26_005238 [Claviceps purpurea]KAG6245614.1 hypothetical protein E4U24_004318 [Claviceps purpurea]KAG6260384.1 hypothetical protein E4U49_004883 [Claviceps purpurea]KAG6310280.1 hypothetical protein E4U22_003384 [Claviceps purpurea]